MNHQVEHTEESNALHSLLKAQISQHLPGADIEPLMPLLNAISSSYSNFETNQPKATSDELIENSVRFNFLLKNSFDIMTIINPNGTVVYQSPAFYRIFGYTEEEIVGCNGFEYIHPDDLEHVGNVMRMGIENPGTMHSCEYRSLKSDGTYLWFETTGSYVIEDSFTGIILNSREITERKRAEKQRIAQSQLLETITRTMPILVYNVDGDGVFTSIKGNALKRIGSTEQDIVGTSVYERLKDRTEEIQKAYSGEIVNFINRVTNGDEEDDLFFEHFLFLDESGSEKKLIGFAIDVTEGKQDENRLKDYYETLERTNRELDQFAYIVSHDLKAPLRAISNLSIWIEEDMGEDLKEDAKTNFDMMRGRIHRMESLINGILEYSRAGRAQSTPSTFNITSMVNETVTALAPPQHFTVEVQQDMPDVIADRIKIEQVFSNFISNAIKYNNNPTPSIKVKYDEDLTHYIFSVEDNGPGIDPDYHEKVFVIFQTLQARDKVESTGVGLAIVKKIIEDAGGRTWVESEIGKGSTFYFTLPKPLAMAA